MIENAFNRVTIDGIKEAAAAEMQKRDWCHLRMNNSLDEIREAVTEIAKVYVPDFEWQEDYDKLLGYIQDNHGKGLLLMGQCGTGKTLFATKILPAIWRSCHNKILKVFNASKMNKQSAEVLEKRFLCIDDLGSEPRHKEYGTEKEVFSEVMDAAEKDGNLVVVTTNLGGKELIERYGQRTTDRIKTTCHVVWWNNIQSMRK